MKLLAFQTSRQKTIWNNLKVENQCTTINNYVYKYICIYKFNVNQFSIGFIVILCLLSSNLDKVTNMYKIPCFHPFKVQDSKLIVPKLKSHDGDTMQLQLNLLNDFQILFLMNIEQHSALSRTWWCWWTLQKSK